MAYYAAPLIPKAFIWRRIHSLTGLWFTLFLIEHLFVNSQAALLIGDDGNGFVRAVNAIRDLPFLPIIEIFLLGVPFLIHAIWGIKYLFTGEMNSFSTDGTTPSLPQYPRNHTYTWQRITSWILLAGIIAHVIHMRFIEYPQESNKVYSIEITPDKGLETLSKRLGFQYEGSEDKVIAHTNNFGTAELLMVRNTFKSPLMIFLYTILVLAACFHGFNGLWTFMIKWGITLTARSQQLMRRIAVFLMCLISLLGLAAIWGTYWINLID